MFKILVAEQEVATLRAISSFLTDDIFQIDEALDGAQAYRLVIRNNYDAVILDRSLPLFSTLDICKELRAGGSRSAIFVLSGHSLPDDRERMLDAGADDYLTKPVEGRELTAKVKAAIRRRQPCGYIQTLACEQLTLDTRTREVLIHDAPLRLRPMEFRVLEYLLRNQGRIVSAQELWHEVWHQNSAPSDTVRAHINLLRKKLRNQGSAQQMIQTIQGRGYKMEASSQEAVVAGR